MFICRMVKAKPSRTSAGEEITLEGISLKMLHEGMGRGRGQSKPSPLLLTLSIRLTWYLARTMGFALYFQLIETT